MTKPAINSSLVRELAKVLDENNLSEIECEYDNESVRIRIARGGVAAPVAPPVTHIVAQAPPPPAAAAAQAVDNAHHPGAIKAPMVGVVYLGPEPGASPYVREGGTVAEGDTLVLIEAMKTFNPVKAPRAGRVVRVLVNDGNPVEYGEPLIIIE
ncbi:MAG: acetyl-CoA carboxylase biotin carboxyl carrier protein [Alphaproteobacteria bacterium]